MIDLFINLLRGDAFHYGDQPDRILMKTDDDVYTGPMGEHHIDPYVAVIPQYPRESKGDSDERGNR